MAVKWNPFLTLRRWNWFGRFATDAGSDETTRVSRIELDSLETRQRLTPDVSTELFAHDARGILQVVIDCEKERGAGAKWRGTIVSSVSDVLARQCDPRERR